MHRTQLRPANAPQRDRATPWSPTPFVGPWQRLGAGTALAAMVGMALAQSSSATYNVPRQSIDGGAQRASSATYTLNGTIGQPDAGAATSSPTFAVRGGFHVAAAGGPPSDAIFANGFEP